jgi:hypothetical protein
MECAKMGLGSSIQRLIGGLIVASVTTAGGPVIAQELARGNPGLAFRPIVVRVIPHGSDGGDRPSGFGIIMGERDGKLYVATADHVVRGGTPDVLTDHPDVVFFQERPDRRPAERLPEHLGPESGDLAVLRVLQPPNFVATALPVVPVGKLSWGTAVWNIGRDGEWIVPTSPAGFQDQQPRSGLLVFDRMAAPPGASGSAVVAEAGVVGMIVIDAGRGDVAYALPAEMLQHQFQLWGFPIHTAAAAPGAQTVDPRAESPAVRRAKYETAAHNCNLVADGRDPAKPPDVPGTQLGSGVIIGEPPPLTPIIEACRLAADGLRDTPRYRYQLGLALELAGRTADAEGAWQAAGEAGYPTAWRVLGTSLSSRDPAAAARALLRGVEAGDSYSAVELSELLLEHTKETLPSKDADRLVRNLTQKATGNDGNAALALGILFEKGVVVERDITVAQQWFIRARDLGQIDASEYLESLSRQNQ